MEKKRKIRYEFLIFSTDSTLILENPLSVEFINTSPDTNPAFGDVIINQFIRLVPRWRAIASSLGPALVPFNYSDDYKLTLNNNINEIDVTQYQIRFRSPSLLNRLIVIVKYNVV